MHTPLFLLQTFPYYPRRSLNTRSAPTGSIYSQRTTDQEKYSFGFRGVTTEEEYQALLKKDRMAPLDFHGYNNYPDYWPFWCSEPYTYVTSMLALAKFSNTVEEQFNTN